MQGEVVAQQAAIDTNKPNNDQAATVINVAVAVIHYKQQYLLGFRNRNQHQGDRYEFVGGKIDKGEDASAALIREVSEETAIDISNTSINVAVKLGRLYHDYGDKKVCLQVYKVALSSEQYQRHKNDTYGSEGQALTWVDEAELLAGQYPLPAANQTILAWLRLPAQISISYPLAHFHSADNSRKAWLNYHEQHIARGAWVYIRVKDHHSASLAEQLLASRADIYSIVPNQDNVKISPETSNTSDDRSLNRRVNAVHLSHSELLEWFDYCQHSAKDRQPLTTAYPLIVSCHDVASIQIANKLAAIRLQHKQPPVIGIFLAPVLATATHPDTRPLGWKAWSSLAQLADMPVIALGGLAPKLNQVATSHGATSIAGIRQFLMH